MRERPLSPHFTVYKMTRYCLLSSISNRLTGIALSIGLLVLVYWLTAAASGEQAYQRARALLGSLPLQLLYALLLLAFVYHLLAGIRHLVWDAGRGLERAQSRASAWFIMIAAVVLWLALGYWAVRAHAGAP
jgi:succinate dehydrogenase / fumarate reductase cytochrome b subunit